MLEDAKKRMAENVICNLKKRNMEGIYCRDKKEAGETVLSLIEPGASIGWGGSDGKPFISRLLQCGLFPYGNECDHRKRRTGQY